MKKKFTTDKMSVITCFGGNGTYDVRVPKGTTLSIHRHLKQPVLLERNEISETAYKEFYAPPAPIKQEPKPKKTKEDN